MFGGFIFLAVWLNIDDGFTLLPEKYRNGELVVLFIALSQLFNVATGVNGKIIINSKYYRFDLYSNFILLFLALYTNWIFIQESSPLAMYNIVGINGAAFATALSVFIFNIIKMIFLYIKMKIQPFTYKTLLAVFLIVGVYFAVYYIPVIDNMNNDILFAVINCCIRLLLILLIFIPLLVWMRVSEDINNVLYEDFFL